MERPDLSKVTKILTSGTWFDIKGTRRSGGGIMHMGAGNNVEPLYRFTLPDGVEGVILVRCLDGWAPLDTDEMAARKPDLSEFRQPAGVPGIRGFDPLGLNRP